jgi:siroheme synthase
VTVHLVGAGPGDPELVTVRGAALLARADVIIYDRLIAHSLLDLAPPGAERIDVGKKPGRPTRQSDINALLIEHGGKGREVVRLKGGDPFLFGRGGEEAEALQAAGIPYDVVPGGTLVVMMGMADRARIAEALIDGGRPGDTPVTVVHWGTTDEQRTERTTLDGLAEVDLPAPCTIVIGPVAGLDLRSTAANPGGGEPT